MNSFARAWREQPRGGAVDEVVDEASVMEVADSSAYNSFARQLIGLPRERANRIEYVKFVFRSSLLTLSTTRSAA
ncbi:hypothetical protein T492DRAFT_858635 [Pavlovales sp. CCMP2436]|nr:hypothetical protein T492DRAFT_858635 [Pavlovales sp. CCMP2436]